uniref:Uncharacterized protein n=1 Tax=Physcomitrium patens TaxID=3218 RepID=A0A2K1KHY2_PHYPA|nr:hypothetical protein PHYPA_007065 [Physcomitrium patens]
MSLSRFCQAEIFDRMMLILLRIRQVFVGALATLEPVTEFGRSSLDHSRFQNQNVCVPSRLRDGPSVTA